MNDSNILTVLSAVGAELQRVKSEAAFYRMEAERLKRLLDEKDEKQETSFGGAQSA